MDNIDKINIINEKIRLLDRAIIIMQKNIRIDGEKRPGKSFEQMLGDMLAKKEALLKHRADIDNI